MNSMTTVEFMDWSAQSTSSTIKIGMNVKSNDVSNFSILRIYFDDSRVCSDPALDRCYCFVFEPI
jgi:hypothetical protein